MQRIKADVGRIDLVMILTWLGQIYFYRSRLFRTIDGRFRKSDVIAILLKSYRLSLGKFDFRLSGLPINPCWR